MQNVPIADQRFRFLWGFATRTFCGFYLASESVATVGELHENTCLQHGELFGLTFGAL